VPPFETLCLGLLVGFALGVGAAHWLDRLDQLDAQPEPEPEPEPEPPSAARLPPDIVMIHGHPTVRWSLNPDMDAWPKILWN
jgi:hypothetical protein